MRQFLTLGITLVLSLLLLAPLHAQELTGDDPELEGSLGYGYTLGDGSVAVAPWTSYLYCPGIEVLVIHPEQVESTMASLGAEVLPTGDWLIEGNYFVTPQIAQFVIETSSNGGAVALEPTLPAIHVSQVALALNFNGAACKKEVSGHVCDEYDCTGCVGRNKQSGGKMSYCRATNKASDKCELTGGEKTCTITSYSQDKCKGDILATAKVKYKSCK